MKRIYRYRFSTADRNAGSTIDNPRFPIYGIKELFDAELYVEYFNLSPTDNFLEHISVNLVMDNFNSSDIYTLNPKDKFILTVPIEVTKTYDTAVPPVQLSQTFSFKGYVGDMNSFPFRLSQGASTLSTVQFHMEYENRAILEQNTDYNNDWYISLVIIDNLPKQP